MADQTNYIYQTIISDMTEGLMVIGFNGVITHLNHAGEEILEKNREKLIGKKFASCFIRYEENDKFNQAIIDAIYDRTKTHKNIVEYYNGKSFKVLNITTSFLHNDGEKVGIIIVLNDISELVELRDAVKAMERIKKLNSQLELRNKLLSNTFGRYLSDDIVKELLDTPGGLELGGKKRSISILMSDLRGFTQLSDVLDPSEIIDMLNHYLTIMCDIVSEHKGTVIDFIGDGMLVIFGAPIETENHALNALLTALYMQAAMPEINKWNRDNNYPELSMGIGINTGETIVGNIGSEKKTKYGVIGKHVNICSRIESYTIGGQILISPLTKQSIEESLVIGEEFEVLPKGLDETIVLSEVLGINGKYNVFAPKVSIDVIPLKNYYDFDFYEIDDKHINIISISKTHAIIITSVKLAPFADLAIIDTVKVYCKVMHIINEGYLIAFTTDSSALLEKIEQSEA